MLHLDSVAIRRAFGRNAATYDQAASLQFAIGQQLLAQLDQIPITPHTILDVGAGTGWASAALQQRFPQAHIIALDFALPMLMLSRHGATVATSYICADAAFMPLRNETIDLIYSNAMLQWCNDLPQVFTNLQQILTTNGRLVFTTFGPKTLQELRLAWAEADDYPHVSTFPSVDDLRKSLEQANFTEIKLHSELKNLPCTDVKDLMLNLKTLGANNAMYGRAKGLTGKQRFAAMLRAYEHKRVANYLPVTYEVIYAESVAKHVSN